MNREPREQNLSNMQDLAYLGALTKEISYSTDAINASRYAVTLVNALGVNLPLTSIASDAEIHETLKKVDGRAIQIAGIVTLLSTLIRNDIITFEEVVVATATALEKSGFSLASVPSKIENLINTEKENKKAWYENRA